MSANKERYSSFGACAHAARAGLLFLKENQKGAMQNDEEKNLKKQK